jgi:hypothetical protein
VKFSVKGVFVVNVDGNSIKLLATGQSERRAFSSWPALAPRRTLSKVKKLAGDWMTTRADKIVSRI